MQKSLTCLRANENWYFNRSDLRNSCQSKAPWNFNNIIQFAPLNTFSTVRSVSCVYLAGITLTGCAVWPMGPIIKRHCVPKGDGVMSTALFLCSLRTPEPRSYVLAGTHQHSQLVITSFKNPLSLFFSFSSSSFSIHWGVALSVKQKHLEQTSAPSHMKPNTENVPCLGFYRNLNKNDWLILLTQGTTC